MDPGPVAYSDAASQRALEALLAARAGPKGMEELERALARCAGRDSERDNPLLGRLGHASADREFYQAVYRRLVELHPLPPNALQQLGPRRSGAIVEYLAGSAGIEPSRLESGEVRPVHAAADEPVTLQLVLDVVKPSRDAASRGGRGMTSWRPERRRSRSAPSSRVGAPIDVPHPGECPVGPKG
jgi:hypothetical protein